MHSLFKGAIFKRVIFWAALLAVLVLSLMPGTTEMPSTGWDKTNHLFGFSVLAFLGLWAYPGRTLVLMAALLAYGGLIEILQSLTPDRMAEWGDWVADALGLVVGWCLFVGCRQIASKVRVGRSTG